MSPRIGRKARRGGRRGGMVELSSRKEGRVEPSVRLEEVSMEGRALPKFEGRKDRSQMSLKAKNKTRRRREGRDG